jgi:LCP family protein required for cell wall assembly
MSSEEKPYRVYRGGRAKGKVPTLPRPQRGPKPDGGGPDRPGTRTKPKKRRNYHRWFAIGLGVVLAWFTAWTLAGYFTFRDGVKAANARLPKHVRSQLKEQGGLLLTHPTTMLLLGTDTGPGRKGIRHSDSVMLVRTDPDHHRISYLSIPRDLRVEIPGHGADKINAAYQIGGAPLAVATVRNLTGMDINHVAIVNFARFEKLIDAIGGIDVNVPAPIRSDHFDCPYSHERCQTWKGWRFAKGKQHMDGRRALIYSRVRVNELNPADNDITRAERQQQVIQAIAGKLASAGTYFDMPFIGDDLLRPLATDLTPGQLMQLGWVYWRSGSGKALHCRLGGQPDGGYLISDAELNLATIAMFKGESAPQPPPPGSGTFGAGCVQGNRKLGVR